MPGTGPVLQALQEGGQGQHREVPAAHPPGCCQVRNAPAMLGRLWRSWKDWTVGCRCGMKGASSLPRRRRPVRDSSEPATGVPHLFLSHPPAPTAWGNAGRRLSNNWTQGSRTRGIRGPSPAAPPPASPKPPPRASRRSWRGRDGNGLGERWTAALEQLDSRVENERDPGAITGSTAAGKPKAASPRKPTFLERERWKAIQKARRKGMSLRAIERELGIHRATVRKYLEAEGPPPPRRPWADPTTSSSDTMAAKPIDISAGHLDGHLP